MQDFELQSLDTRLGKFEGIQQQHDARLADIERRLGTIEVLIADVRTEGHREREAVRAELVAKIDAVDTKLTGKIDAVETKLSERIESVRTELLGKIDDVSAKIEAFRSEVNASLERVNNRIDSQYKWTISVLVVLVTALLGMMFREFWGGK